jgi:hypothetical protein
MRRILTIATAFVFSIAATTGVARAADPSGGEGTVNVTTPGQPGGQGSGSYNPSGTGATASQPGQAPPALPGPGEEGSSGYTYIKIDSTNPKLNPHLRAHNPCPPGTTGYAVYDSTGNLVGVACPSNQPAGPTATPEQLAQQASAKQPWPTLAVAANPTSGVAGMESWFWVTGSPAMPDATASVPALTVTVSAQFVDAILQFGDGTTIDVGTDLGQPYPARSDIRHTYQTDSYGQAGGFVVAVQVVYRVSYSANGGPPVQFGFKGNTYSRSFVVNQIQPQGVQA